MIGWIKIHRQLIDWEWYDDPNTFRLFMHILLKANHKPKKYRGVNIKAGQVMTGHHLLAVELGLSRAQIRLALSKLETTNEITIKSSPQGTIIQVVKYLDYQVTTNETTIKQPTNNQRTTTNKKDKKEEKLLAELDKSKIDIFNKWFKYRKEIKKPIASETTLKTLIKKFNAEGLDKCEYVVNSSIENSWQGLFRDKYVETTQQKSRDQKQLEYIKAQIKKSDVSE